jgi:hypothetical protein
MGPLRLRNLIKRRPRPDMGWSAEEEEEEPFGVLCFLHFHGNRFLRTVGTFIPNYTPSYLRRQ